MKMTDDTFAKLVAEDVKNKVTPANRRMLLEKSNWSRWERALIALVENLNNQLNDIASDEEADRERYADIEDGHVLLSEALAAYDMRRKKIERFRFHVENKLSEVSKMIETGLPPEDDIMTRLVTLQKAIKTHKEMLHQYTIEATAIDRALWDVLDGKWSFDGISESDLAELSV
jgi:hypothetical protein